MTGYELNAGKGGICIVGSHPTFRDVREGRPFTGREGKILDSALNEAGLLRGGVNLLNLVTAKPYGSKGLAGYYDSTVQAGVASLHQELRRLEPSVILALGPEVCHALVPEWPDARDRESRKLVHRGNIKRAADIENRRGYVFDSAFGPVLASVPPSLVEMMWVPWRVMMSYDFQRAHEIHRHGFERPTRDVDIITSDAQARRAIKQLLTYDRLAADIETWDDTSLACIGFSGDPSKAFVFPQRFARYAQELLHRPTIWANGIYDLFCLRYREDFDITGELHDVQLAWHACYPELAGKKEKKGVKMTRKSLAFLAALFTHDHYWKGDYETEEEFFIYNGKDCCITLDVANGLEAHLDALGARETYDHERALMMPCVDMLERGLRVDDELRLSRIEALAVRREEEVAALNEIVVPILQKNEEMLKKREVWRLFEKRAGVCECCRHGTGKQQKCWGCAGFDKAPSKEALVDAGGDEELSKAELEALFLKPCKVCGGEPRAEWLEFNPKSAEQKAVLLYDIFGMPKRMSGGKITTDEAALKSLLGVIGE